MLRPSAGRCEVGQISTAPCWVHARCPNERHCRRQGDRQRQPGLRQHRQHVQVRATSYDAPARDMQRQRQRQPRTDTGGDGGGGGWGWGGGSSGQPPRRGGGSGGGDSEDDDGADEPVGNPFQRVAMSVRLRQTADPWFFWRLTAAAAADMLAVLVVNRAVHPAKLMQPSEAVLSQVLVTLLNALAIGIVMEPFSGRVRAELRVLRLDSGPAAISSPLRWTPAQLGSGPASGPAMLARRLLRQGLQLGLVGLLTGLAGSAAAHQLARWQRRTSAAKPLPACKPQDADTAGSGPGDARGCQPAGGKKLQPHAHVLQRSAMQRVLFMALSANVRHAGLYAAEDRLCVYAGAPAVVHATRALLYGANTLLAAAEWRHVSGPIYAGW